MNKLFKTVITLTAIGVAVKVVRNIPNKIDRGTLSGKKMNLINSNRGNLS
ncbi:hypothetical protein [Carnobacterium inhibens]|nr:hypothetical protein [Carnobacterium inhibens]